MNALFKVENLRKEFKLKDGSVQEVLSNIKFSVGKGECFTLIGPNGSGKTTLLRILDLLEKPTEGKIYYKGRELTSLTQVEKVSLRRKFAFLRQKPVVLNTSVYNNISYGLKVRGYSDEEIKKRTNRIIELIGLKGLEKKNARDLSGGEMQRVAIAMNFVLDPEIYLLDEMSANLDPQNVILLENFINKVKKKNKTMIICTHNRTEAIKFSDRLAVLNKGKISQIGNINEIFTSPKDEYAAYFIGYENIFNGIAKYDKEIHLTRVKIKDTIINAAEKTNGFVKVCIRPESIGIMRKAPTDTSYQNSIKGNIKQIRELGNKCHLIVQSNAEEFLVTITKLSLNEMQLKKGSKIYLNFKATDIKLLKFRTSYF